MSDIVRAWKDETYRQNLSVEEQGVLPANPVGEIDLTDEELEAVYGARRKDNLPPVYLTSYSPQDNRQWTMSGGSPSFTESGSCNDPFNLVPAGSSTGAIPGILNGAGGGLFG
jgi:mersacidin/lichenicidin family type 2 lantibiotic